MRSFQRACLFSAATLVLAMGCTPRAGVGGGGFFVDPDAAGTQGDGAASPDGGTAGPDGESPGLDVQLPGQDVIPTGMDVPTPPVDVPVGVDVGKPPADIPVPPVDVPPGPSCGDSSCNNGETCTSCPGDCGACPVRCGDGTCSSTETCTSCPSDCGACPARCGDGTCSSTETCTSCPSDCGACPDPCAAVSACGTCAVTPSCAWCRTTSRCVASAGATCTDLVTSATNCTVTPPTNITSTCATTTTRASDDCGFRLAATYTCTPGATVTFGCTGGSDAGACGFSGGTCVGDPVLRVCAGNTTTGCAFASRIQPQNPGSGTQPADDDACGLCPWARVLCPSAGSVSVFTRAYDISAPATCTIAR